MLANSDLSLSGYFGPFPVGVIQTFSCRGRCSLAEREAVRPFHSNDVGKAPKTARRETRL